MLSPRVLEALSNRPARYGTAKKRRDAIDVARSQAEVAAAGRHQAAAGLREREGAARDMLHRAEQAHLPRPLPDHERAALTEEIRKTQLARDQQAIRSGQEAEREQGWRRIDESTASYLAQTIGAGIELVPDDVRPQPLDALPELLHQRATIMGAQRDTRNAPRSPEEVRAGLVAQLPEVPSLLTVRGIGSKNPTLMVPLVHVHAEPTTDGHLPTAPDALAVAAWMDRARLEAEIDQQIDEYYADIDFAPTPAQRRRRLTDLAEQRLQVERVICSTLWAAHEAGQDITWPDWLDPRAVLGVSGPAPIVSADDRKAEEAGEPE